MINTDLIDVKKYLPKNLHIKNLYHAIDVNMNYSFDSLKKLVVETHDKELAEGDVFVCDSVTRRPRKVLIKVKNGWLILYLRIDKQKLRVKD